MLPAIMAAAINSKMLTKGEIPLLPHSTKWAQRGALRASVRHRKIENGKYIVTVGENGPAGAYAAAQEAGQTHGSPIKNYSTPGTGPHFFQHAIDDVKASQSEYVRTAKMANGLEEI